MEYNKQTLNAAQLNRRADYKTENMEKHEYTIRHIFMCLSTY